MNRPSVGALKANITEASYTEDRTLPDPLPARLVAPVFPKGSDLAAFTQTELDAVALDLNTRPRKTLGYKTPSAIFAQDVAPTG